MNRKYYSKPKTSIAVDEDIYGYRHERVSYGNPTVSDHVATDTGLLDKDGNAIMRAPNPIGFIWS